MHDKLYYYKLVGKNIKKYRNFKGLTLDKLSEKIGVNPEYLSCVENIRDERNIFSLALVGRIADALGIPIWYLFDDSDDLHDIPIKNDNHSEDYFYELCRLNIRRYRKSKIPKVTQKDLALKASFHEKTISHIESSNKRAHFTIYSLGRIADALEIAIKNLFNNDGLDIANQFKKQ